MEDFINDVLLPFICYNKHNKSRLCEYSLDDKYIDYLQEKINKYSYIRNKLIEYDITELRDLKYCLPTTCRHTMYLCLHYGGIETDYPAVFCNDCLTKTQFGCDCIRTYRFIYCKYCIKILHYLDSKYDFTNCRCETNMDELQHICNRIGLISFCDNIKKQLSDSEINMLIPNTTKSAATVTFL